MKSLKKVETVAKGRRLAFERETYGINMAGSGCATPTTI
jgi:hypothetical protein